MGVSVACRVNALALRVEGVSHWRLADSPVDGLLLSLFCQYVRLQVEKLKAVNQLLWRAEVDVENIEDMLARLQAPSGLAGLALSGTVANLNQMLSEKVNQWGGQVSQCIRKSAFCLLFFTS